MKRAAEEVEAETPYENKNKREDNGDSERHGVLRNETEFLVQSNLLRLQTEELVGEVQGSASSPSLEKCIERIKACLAPSSSPSSSWLPKEEVNAAWLKSKGIKGLDFTHYGDVEQTLSYKEPVAITSVGTNKFKRAFLFYPCIICRLVMHDLFPLTNTKTTNSVTGLVSIFRFVRSTYRFQNHSSGDTASPYADRMLS